jgi:hypothetical protein
MLAARRKRLVNCRSVSKSRWHNTHGYHAWSVNPHGLLSCAEHRGNRLCRAAGTTCLVPDRRNAPSGAAYAASNSVMRDCTIRTGLGSRHNEQFPFTGSMGLKPRAVWLVALLVCAAMIAGSASAQADSAQPEPAAADSGDRLYQPADDVPKPGTPSRQPFVQLRHQDSWLYEACALAFLSAFLANFLWGRNRNERLAVAWTEEVRMLLPTFVAGSPACTAFPPDQVADSQPRLLPFFIAVQLLSPQLMAPICLPEPYPAAGGAGWHPGNQLCAAGAGGHAGRLTRWCFHRAAAATGDCRAVLAALLLRPSSKGPLLASQRTSLQPYNED